ncbi:hypothetical protein KR067_003335, partial [Drosophila pandora]
VEMRMEFCLILTIGLVRPESLSNILSSLQSETSYRTILLLRSRDTCWDEKQLHNSGPVLSFDRNQSIHLKNYINSKVLALVCLYENENDMLGTLYSSLEEMRDTTTILFALSDEQIGRSFRECLGHKMLNVLAFKGADRKIIYSYRVFPTFQIIRRNVTDIWTYFEPQLKNLGGRIVRALPDNIIPRTVAYRDANGNRKLAGYLFDFIKNYVSTINATLQIVWDLMSGYLTHFYRNFARALNGTLWVRWDLVPEDGTPTHNVTLKLLTDGLVDFPLVLTTLTPEQFYPSYVSEISSWFLMVPVEPDMPPSSLYFNLKGWRYFLGLMVILAFLLVNAHRIESGQGFFTLQCGHIFGDHVLRAILSQSFVMPNTLSHSRTILYSLLMLAGLIVTTFYGTNLATLLVDPPPAYKILSYNDLRLTNGKIFISQQELPTLNESIGQDALNANIDVFEITPSTVEFLTKRNELNTSYGYPVTNTLWPLLQLKQIKLHRPLFRKSHEISFMQFMPVTMPMARNSIYRDVFNRYLSHTLQSGLYDLWFRRSYSELIAIGKLNYSSDMSDGLYHDLVWEDLLYVWIAYIGGTLISLLVFSLEILYF